MAEKVIPHYKVLFPKVYYHVVSHLKKSSILMSIVKIIVYFHQIYQFSTIVLISVVAFAPLKASDYFRL